MPSKRPVQFFLYHSARAGVYVLIGLLFHRFQSLLQLPHWSSNSTTLIGISLLLGVLFYLAVEYFLPPQWSRVLIKISSNAGRLKGGSRSVAFGVLNGLLPCGMVWMAAGVAAPHTPAAMKIKIKNTYAAPA